MKQTEVVEEILLFIEKIMEQKPEIRREIMRLLKKHFDRFKDELHQVLAEGPGGKSDGKNGKNNSGASGRRMGGEPSIFELLRSSNKTRRNMTILKEILDKPLSTRNEKEW